MPESTELKFFTEKLFAGDVGIVDHESAVIKGVSLITTGEAEGHGLTVDQETIKQLHACGTKKNKIPVQLDHGSGISSTIGYVTNFRIDKDKWRADMHLLQTHEETPTMLERAEKMSDTFGLSVAFKGPPKGVPIGGGKMGARCERLISVDLVTRPAANDGLFSVPSVDTPRKGMPKENSQVQPVGKEVAEPTLTEVMAKLTEISERQDAFEQHIAGNANQDLPTLEELDQMSDEDLNALGTTRDEVNSAIDEALAAAGIGDPNAGRVAGEGQGEGEGEAELAGAVASAGGGADASAPATFKALMNRIVRLESSIKLKELAEARATEETQFSDIEGKVVKLAEQRDTAVTLLAEKDSEIEALRLAVRTGTRPVKAGVDNGIRMFGANGSGGLHEFQARVKQLTEGGKSEAEAIRFAQKENPGLHADWVMSLTKKSE